MDTALVERPDSTLRRLRQPLVVTGAVVAASALLHFRDPHQGGSYGFCPFLEITGYPCPGCGGLRAVNLMTNGDLLGAISSNLLAVALVPVFVGYMVVWFRNAAVGRSAPGLILSARTWWAVLAVTMIFWIVRVTPWGAWLAP